MIILTGGSGILGQELQSHVECIVPPRHKLDLTFPWPNTIRSYLPETISHHFKLIVHCAAFTDLDRAEKEKELCYKTNVIGTRNLASLGIPMLYISTAYVFDGEKGNYAEEDIPNPKNFYALTKLLGEFESRRTRSVVVRCLFKSRPFKYPYACHDQFSSGDYVDRIAPEIALAIRQFDDLPDTIHIGFEKKSIYKLARESRPDVKKISVDDITTVKLPKDVSLNCSKWEKIKNGIT